MDALIWMIKATVYLVGLWTLLKFSLVHTAGRRHAIKNKVERKHAVELSDLDKFIQQSDHEMFPTEKHKHLNCYICGPGPLLQGLVPSRHQHPFFKKEMQTTGDGYGSTWQVETVKGATAQTAEMVSSEVVKDGKYTGLHTVMLDIDFPATLMPSSTAGHYHLYIDQTMTWKTYQRLLRELCRAGVIEKGYYNAAKRQGSTMLRPPWVSKYETGGAVKKWPPPKYKRTWKRKGHLP